MKRREFITLLGGAAAWPLASRAQQPGGVRRIGVLMAFAADDPTGHTRILRLAQALGQLGWIDGRNVRIDLRWSAGDPERIRKYAAELVALTPDVILTVGSSTTGPLLQATRTVPVVFVQVADPVGAGFVDSLARPGGNATGFTPFEYAIAGKWLELLKEIAPGVTRAGVLRNLAVAAGPGQFGVIQGAASSLGMEVRPINLRSAGEIESAVAAFARQPNGGLIAVSGAPLGLYRNVIIPLAARHQLPAIYSDPVLAADGGLIAYGPDRIDQYQRAAGYIDRILRGEKPADLPVQASSKYVLVINLKTAQALGLEVPPTLLARADEVIE